jgi:hypothetical protein
VLAQIKFLQFNTCKAFKAVAQEPDSFFEKEDRPKRGLFQRVVGIKEPGQTMTSLNVPNQDKS